MTQIFTNVPVASADTVHGNLLTGTKSTFHGVFKYLDAQGTFKGLFTRNVTVTISISQRLSSTLFQWRQTLWWAKWVAHLFCLSKIKGAAHKKTSDVDDRCKWSCLVAERILWDGGFGKTKHMARWSKRTGGGRGGGGSVANLILIIYIFFPTNNNTSKFRLTSLCPRAMVRRWRGSRLHPSK